MTICSLCERDDDFLVVHGVAKWDENEADFKIIICESCMWNLNPGSHTTGISINEALKDAFIVGLRRTIAGMNPHNTRTGGGSSETR